MIEPIIVTAFWDVGRGENCLIPRSNERYYKEFAEWARIKNQIIVFTDNKSVEAVAKIRKDYGLLEKTKIVVVDNIFEIEAELFAKMKKIEENTETVFFKYHLDAMENRANFDYAWMMKYWCIAEAVKYVESDSVFAWMDFGFNHIDHCYTNMKEFDFLWKCEVDTSKIHLFSLKDINNVLPIDTLQFQFDTIMGVFHIIPIELAEELWRLVKKAMVSLVMLGCIDDDQQLLLMACKDKPELFEIHISSWFMPLKEFGATHLSVKEKETNFAKSAYERILKSRKKIVAFRRRSVYRANKFYGFTFSAAKKFVKKYWRKK